MIQIIEMVNEAMTRNLTISVWGSRNGEIPLYPGRLVDWVMDEEGLVRVGYKGLLAQGVCPGAHPTSHDNCWTANRKKVKLQNFIAIIITIPYA